MSFLGIFQRQVDVYHLDTNASYWFRVWATNALGPGPPVEVLATTLYSDQEAGEYLQRCLAGLAVSGSVYYPGVLGFDSYPGQMFV